MPLYILLWVKIPLFLELLSMRLLDLNTAEIQANIKAEDSPISLSYMQQRPTRVFLKTSKMESFMKVVTSF